MDDDADQTLKHRRQEQQRANTKHVGAHPNILHELSMHVEFVEHCRYILNVVLDCIHCGAQAVNLSITCKSNRHGSVGAGYLLGELCRYVKGTAVSITHMEAAKTFPRMPFQACKGRCEQCTHNSLEVWVDVQDILDGFIRKCRAAGIVNNYCILVAEPEAARAAGIESYAERFHRECLQIEEEEAAAAAGPAAPSAGAATSSDAAPAAMEVDDEDSFVVPPEVEGAASTAPPTVEEAVSSAPSYSAPTAKAPAVDANKEYIGKLKAEKEALLAENTRLEETSHREKGPIAEADGRATGGEGETGEEAEEAAPEANGPGREAAVFDLEEEEDDKPQAADEEAAARLKERLLEQKK
ncbi:unnamed protein product, partial [Symbiodinium microadriaticum]